MISPCGPDWLYVDQVGFKFTILMTQPVAAEITNLRPHFQPLFANTYNAVQDTPWQENVFVVHVSFVRFARRMLDLFRC